MANAKKTQETVEPSAELTTQQRKEMSSVERFDDKALKSVMTYQDALQLAIGAYGDVRDVTEDLGNGFRLVQDTNKGNLKDVPFIILHSAFNEGDFGEFVSVVLVTAAGDKLILNDGSTGIYEQLKQLATDTNRYGGWSVPGGLRVSEYKTCKNCGKPRLDSHETCATCGDTNAERNRGATYYLNTSA